MFVTFSRVHTHILGMSCLLAPLAGVAQAQVDSTQESTASGGFSGAFFFSQSTGPDLSLIHI